MPFGLRYLKTIGEVQELNDDSKRPKKHQGAFRGTGEPGFRDGIDRHRGHQVLPLYRVSLHRPQIRYQAIKDEILYHTKPWLFDERT